MVKKAIVISYDNGSFFLCIYDQISYFVHVLCDSVYIRDNEQRLNAAVFWLENTDHTITDIWLDAGFESQRTFNRVFREKYKVTPRDYRKWYAEQNAPGKIEGTEYDKMS